MKFFISLILLTLLVFLKDVPVILTKRYLIFVLSLNLVALILFSLRRENEVNLKKQYFKISTLFLVGFIIVHFQIYLEYVLGTYENFGQDYFYDTTMVPKATLVASIALNAFLLGYMFFKKENIRIKKEYKISPKKLIFYFNLIMFFLFILTTDFKYFLGGYGRNGIELSALSSFSNEFYLFSTLGYIIIIVRNSLIKNNQIDNLFDYLKLFNFFFKVVLFMFFILVLLSGDRGPLIQIGLVLFGGFIILSKKKYKLPTVIFLLFIAASLISFIAYVREFKDTNSYLEKIEIANKAKSVSGKSKAFSSNTLELAASVRSYHAAIIFTENVSHTYGIFQGFQLFSIIPGFRSVFLSLTGVDSEDVVSTKFLTRQIQGEEITHGLGTTSLADIYLDFGVIGTLIMFYGFGYFLRMLEVKIFISQAPSLFSSSLFFVFLSKSVYLGRSQIMMVFKEAVIIFLIIILFTYLSELLMKFKIDLKKNEN
ncbi:oligosaccharide repeat unit polymerase [Belliella buryatensis]|uniref:Oligosaccharide repeat unit polymerase n=1 Tax=Belliella buryatensis TaxID=1500549 RepID=A0A239CT31_9BACT|nr:O-antigen polymerase [Belliella buryatensis]SNS23345.1 oligosaccharide repeat unit polymerase [Belliella buryatensis]